MACLNRLWTSQLLPTEPARSSTETAAVGWIHYGLLGNRHERVASVASLPKIDVLDRVVSPAEDQRATRTINLRPFHRGNHRVAGRPIAPCRAKPDIQKSRRVEALYGIDVSLLPHPLLESGEERFVDRVIEIVGVVKGRPDAIGSWPLCLNGAVGQEPRAIERNAALQAGCLIILDEPHSPSACEEGEHGIGLQHGETRDQGLELHLWEGQHKVLD